MTDGLGPAVGAPTVRQGALLAVVAACAVGFAVGSSITPAGDFEQLYAAVRGLWAGISPYDVEAQAVLLREQFALARTPGLMPFAYPPWVALLYAPLGLLSPGQAGRAFLLWNCALLVAAIVLLTRDRPDIDRLWVGLGTALFAPVLGHLGVGQHTIPVLLGAALLPVAWKSRSAIGVGVGFWLLSLKPHLGLPVAVAFAVPLLGRVRSGLWWGTALVVGSGLVSFAVAPGWPVDWPRSVLSLSVSETLQICDTCSGLSRIVSDRWLSGEGRSILAAGLLTVVAVVAAVRGLFSNPELAVAAGCAAAVCCLPYVRNYDGVLLVAPLAVVVCTTTERHVRLGAAIVWMVPIVGLGDRRLSGASVGIAAALVLGLLLMLPRMPKVTNA